MICLRCGYCCTCLDVLIVNPISIQPDGSVDHSGPRAVVFKPSRQRCPHLQFRGNEAVCTIHHLPCYRGTPCDQFDQFGPEDSVCVMGGYFKARDRSRTSEIDDE